MAELCAARLSCRRSFYTYARKHFEAFCVVAPRVLSMPLHVKSTVRSEWGLDGPPGGISRRTDRRRCPNGMSSLQSNLRLLPTNWSSFLVAARSCLSLYQCTLNPLLTNVRHLLRKSSLLLSPFSRLPGITVCIGEIEELDLFRRTREVLPLYSRPLSASTL